MLPAAKPIDEQARLDALACYQILDTAPEAEFDALTEIAARILDMPIVLVSIVDADRQWFKARFGLDAPETPRGISFCGHAVLASQLLVVPDALTDPRFADNPLVTGAPHVRFYAGVPLVTPDGFALGTLCAIDHKPRELNAEQVRLLQMLGRQAFTLLARRRTENALFAEKETARITLGAITEAVITADAAGQVVYLNPVAERMTGWAQAMAKGQPLVAVLALRAFSGQSDADRLREAVAGHAVTAEKKTAWLLRRDGSEIAVEYTLSSLHDPEGKSLGAVVVAHDVSEARALAIRMARLAHHDPLTGLPNRLLLHDRMEQAVEDARRGKTQFAVVFIDLDEFKDLSSQIGEQAADEVVRTVAHRLRASVRGTDTTARFGGDEFVVLLSDVIDKAGAIAQATKLLDVMREPLQVGALTVPASFSIGLSVFPDDDTDADTLLGYAESAMHDAKHAGRNCLRVHGG